MKRRNFVQASLAIGTHIHEEQPTLLAKLRRGDGSAKAVAQAEIGQRVGQIGDQRAGFGCLNLGHGG